MSSALEAPRLAASETGAAADTIYARNVAPPLPSQGPLPDRADVVIVGGGLTGASAALHLAEHGFAPQLLEAGKIGDGASGRNGGQLHSGQRQDQITLSEAVGRERADALWRIGGEAIHLVHALRTRLRADCGFRPGIIHAAHNARSFEDLKRYAAYLARWHGVESDTLSATDLAEAIGSERYVGGVRDPSGGHLNPFALVAALALAAHLAGARMHAGARVSAVEREGSGWRLRVRTGGSDHEMAADHVLFAGNGMMRGLWAEADRRIIPLLNHIVATRPLPPLILGGEAVSDTRFVIRYFRQDPDGRLIFGGGESFGRPKDVGRLVRRALGEVYPDLQDVPFDAAWSGTLGITQTRMPMIRRLDERLFIAAGFSGQGLGLSVMAGKVIADAIAGETARLEDFEAMPVPPVPGGRLFQGVISRLAMSYYALRDRL